MLTCVGDATRRFAMPPEAPERDFSDARALQDLEPRRRISHAALPGTKPRLQKREYAGAQPGRARQRWRPRFHRSLSLSRGCAYVRPHGESNPDSYIESVVS